MSRSEKTAFDGVIGRASVGADRYMNHTASATHLLTELGVLIETKLGIHAEDVSTLDLGERVDLNLCGILLLEKLVELDEDVGRLLLVLSLESELLGRLDGELLGQSIVKVDGDGDDGRRVVAGNILDAVG